MTTMEQAFQKFAQSSEPSQKTRQISATLRLTEQKRQFWQEIQTETCRRLTQPFFAGMSYADVKALTVRDARGGNSTINPTSTPTR